MALILEVNGRLAHSPYQLRTDAKRILAQVEECYLRLTGVGLPTGVRIL